MRVLMVAAEAVPFAKTGGLADVAGVLPRFLAARGHDVRVVMPRYHRIDRTRLKRVGGPLAVPMGIIGELWAAVYEGRLHNSDVPIYFIDFEQYYGRHDLYNQPSGEGYVDNDNRFVFLSRAALQLCKMLGFAPDVVHCNDWHTAAIPVFLNTHYAGDPVLREAASLLTIHNMEYQGSYYAGLMNVLGVGWSHYNPRELQHGGEVNLLKGGLYHATLINSVSPGYAAEIQTPEFGHGLDGVARERRFDLFGILNGIDDEEWDPSRDPHLAAPFSADDLAGKAVCKAALQREARLPERPEVPLFGWISRLVHQKGVDVFARIVERLLDLDLQIVLLGSGEPWAHAFFGGVAARRPNFACHLGYNDPLAHRIEAGADFFLMPSRFEPCGLNQLYSLRYGTLPIVHAVGGLNDTVENFDEQTLEGTGFKLYDLTPSALYNTIGWALHTYFNRPGALEVMRRRAMRLRFTWEDAAESYERLYAEGVRRRTGKVLPELGARRPESHTAVVNGPVVGPPGK
jgi:starch synthase